MTIVVINVDKRFFLIFYKKRFLTGFYFSSVFLFFKMLNNQCENDSNLKHSVQKPKQSKCCP